MRRGPIRTILFLFFLIIPFGFVAGQEADSVQSEGLEVRAFDKKMIEEFRSSDEFQYVQPPDARPQWLKIIFNRLLQWLVALLGNEGFAWAVLVILMILGIVGLGFAFYGIFGIGKTIPMYLTDKEKLAYSVEKEDIHGMNFPEEIDLAVSQGNYKKAIRMLYLFTLKLFADHELIEWRPSKTNHDYMYEINAQEIKSGFSAISYIFEYVWYGDFAADANHYSEMNTAFLELKKSLAKDE